MIHEAEIDLSTEQDENKQAHDERGRHHKLVELSGLAWFRSEAEGLLVAEHDPENKDRHEAARLQAVGRKVGTDDGHQRDHRTVFGEERPSFVRDKQCRQISKCGAGDDADDRLLD